MDSSVSALRCILLQLDATPESAARLALARRLALRHAATLCAMFIASRNEESTQLPACEESTALQQQMEWGEIPGSTCLFDDALAEGVQLVRWLSSGADPVEACCQQALYANLLVPGQHDASTLLSGTSPKNFVESVVMASGK